MVTSVAAGVALAAVQCCRRLKCCCFCRSSFFVFVFLFLVSVLFAALVVAVAASVVVNAIEISWDFVDCC